MSKVEIAVIVVLLVLILYTISFFSGSETAYLSISKIKMHRLVREKKRNSKIAYELKNNIDELLSVVLIGTNFMNSLASALATFLAIHLVGNSGVGIATAVVTFCSTIFGQIIPKTVANFHNEKTVCKNAVPLFLLEKIFFPIVWFFTLISKACGKISEKIWKKEDALVTEEELVALFKVGEKEGTLNQNESRMLNKIFKFNDLSVHDIMKHRSFVRSVSKKASREEVVAKFNSSGLKMIAVYDEKPEYLVGVIHFKSVLLTSEKNTAQTDTDSSKGYAELVMKNVLFVPETFTALELLSKFKNEGTEFAVALNEQGETSGVVTMDDILRVVFGRMTDETSVTVIPERRIKVISQNEFIVPGDMKIDDVNDILKLGIESDSFMTFGGWLLEQFGYLPSTGEICIWNKCLFIVEEQVQRRIISVRIRLEVTSR